MNILLNFFPVQSGGGQQVASSFLKIIAKNDFGHKWFVFTGEGSELDVLAKKVLPEENILSVRYSYLARYTNNKLLTNFSSRHHIDMVYNYAIVLPLPKIPQVVRTVYSNLYFPEIKFWNSYPKTEQVKKKLIDYFRLKGTLKADGLIFENESMLERAVSLFHYSRDRVKYIEPSVSYFDESQTNSEFDKLRQISVFKILYLSSWHLNKNITVLPLVAKMLKESGVSVKFILSLEANNPNLEVHLMAVITALEVSEYFEFIGKVKAIHVHQVVKACDAMILLSKLECFSSNVIEAFYFKKPLIIADEPWSRAACGNAAIYVQRDNPEDIKNKITTLIQHTGQSEEMIALGSIRLKEFNTPEEKVLKQVEFLEYIYGKF